MGPANAKLQGDEIGRALEHYNLSEIVEIKPLKAGNAAAPKHIVITEKGKYLLKRRAGGKDDPYRIAFVHAVVQHLARKRFPVAPIVLTKNRHTALLLNKHVYEMFKFIEGTRCSGSSEAVKNAGIHLAMFHDRIADFPVQFDPALPTYHDSHDIRNAIEVIADPDKGPKNHAQLRKEAQHLAKHYQRSCDKVNQLGYKQWPRRIIHGDWHAGNMLFNNEKVAAVLDFDSVKPAPLVCDIASGTLHFSIVAGRPNPAQWPEYLDIEKAVSFLSGYKGVLSPQPEQIDALPDLMNEAMIAETVLSIAATGMFANASGPVFLEMIHRKCNWIEQNRADIIEAIK
jgi:Ser/Thr protein kinase RdoA (MazF antagonist)